MTDYRNQSRHHNGGEWEPMNYAVRLDWTACGFGGRRVWWRCPAVGCGRRVAVPLSDYKASMMPTSNPHWNAWRRSWE
jgi:hypothetical protein